MAVIRLHFSPADVRRITLAPRPDALFETALSVRLLLGGPAVHQGRRAPVTRWRHAMDGTPVGRAGVLAELVRRDDYLPDFLLQPTASSFGEAVESAHSLPTARLHQDLARLLEPPEAVRGRNGRLPGADGRLRELAEGSPQGRDMLVRDLRRYHDASIASCWHHVTAAATADRALRAEMLLRGGVDALLTTLAPSWRWQPPTLHLPSPSTFDVPLCGRGLLLVPSFFATRPFLGYHPEEPTVLVYPLHEGAGTTEVSAGALAPLLGRTRAAVLEALRTPATTTALAERTGISLAGASQHAGVLRDAGLISTERTGTAVLHTLRPLGRALLDGRT
ncbi:transcriptional regulator [Streptomyces fungicidicus]|uniref:Transcriptional regulator n=1 Tax=Streptomyces fungicidicus TaxID=68203 RepID=A0A494UUR7_9ACTN|nr:transcriptional regulator [Streptomyces fungicidicus]